MTINLNIMRPVGFHKNINKNLKKCILRVDKGSGWKKTVKCPICQSKKHIFWLKKFKISINKCLKCDTGYVTSVPKNIDDVYKSETQFKHHQKSYQKTRDYRIKRFGKERLDLLLKYKKKGKLIDIGCGNGWFLETSRKKFNCEGLELNESLANFTEKQLKIKIYKDYKFLKDNSYDIITLFDLIEHVKDPVSFIKFLTKKLKKGGILLIYTPNKNSIGFDYLKEKQNNVVPPFHLTYFCKKSFQFFPKNLKIIYCATFGLDVGDIYAYERDFKDKILAKNLKNNYTKFQDTIDQLGLANHMRVILKKK